MSACLHRSIFDFCSNEETLNGLKEVNPILKQTVEAESVREKIKSPNDVKQREGSLVREVSDKMVCSACKCSFTNREDQMEHYKLDWHRFNLRQKMTGLSPVSVEEFERKTGAGDMSSISGSESDSDVEESDSDPDGNVTGTDNDSATEKTLISGRLSTKVVFQNSSGQYVSVHRCILQAKKIEEDDLLQSFRAVTKKTVWVILMTGGGHYAGAVFQGKDVLQHKTFHRYTVRAKRGTAQGLRDAQNRSHAPKSAGAALRRYNEAALVKDIQEILVSWADYLKEASAIFVRAPSYNKSIFFGGRTAALDKKDPRVRTIPFATRRATFREVQRVHEVLSNVQIYGSETDLSIIFSPSKKTWKKVVKTTVQQDTSNDKENSPESAAEEENDESGAIQLEIEELSITTLDLRESEIYPSKRKRRKKKKDETRIHDEDLDGAEHHTEEELEDAEATDEPQETISKNKKKRKGQKKKELEDMVDDTWEYSMRDALFTACKIGDVDGLMRLLNDHKPDNRTGTADELHSESPLIFLNKPIDSSGFTLLHVASAAAQKAVVKCLLDIGADPACRDNKGQTPYNVAPDKDTRNVYRKYMGDKPDKYDYSKAQVPGPLTAEIESKKLEKKKAQKAQKKQREKDQKEEKKKQEMEVEEKKRFAALSDREKRALAAERRLAEQATATGVSISNVKRCWMCGESLLGKIPFHYLEFLFCSPRCVQQHRKAKAS